MTTNLSAARVSEAGLCTALADGVLTVTLNRPTRRNSQDPALWAALAQVGQDLDPSVRVVILRAEGPSFSAGLDRQMLTPEGLPGQGSLLDLAGLPPAELDERIASYQAAFTWWRRADAVTIAAVQGHAVGAGFQLALACDLMIVAEDATFAMREPSLGLVPDLGGTMPLVAAVGYGRALEMVVSGRWVDAQEAVRLGLALRAVSGVRLELEAQELARSLAVAPRGAVEATKRLLADAAHPSGHTAAHEAQCTAERAAQGQRIRQLAQALG
jgi:enoyl-CoA hydratase/carnithine racemase